MMNTSKPNVVNRLVVAGLVAVSMLMPLVAADLAYNAGAQHADAQPVAAQSAGSDSIR